MPATWIPVKKDERKQKRKMLLDKVKKKAEDNYEKKKKKKDEDEDEDEEYEDCQIMNEENDEDEEMLTIIESGEKEEAGEIEEAMLQMHGEAMIEEERKQEKKEGEIVP